MKNVKKIISAFLLLSVIFLCFTGCERAYAPSLSKFTDYEGVYITIEEIEAEGLSENLKVVWHNETDLNVTFGLWYTVEFYDGAEWKNIQVTDFAIPEIACVLEPHSTVTQNYSTKYFNTLASGDYRIRVEFYISDESGSVSGTSYAPFAKGYK